MYIRMYIVHLGPLVIGNTRKSAMAKNLEFND